MDEILDGILTEIFSFKPTTKKGSFFHELIDKNSTVNYFELNPHAALIQPMVLKQHVDNLCGFHSSFNLLEGIASIKNGNSGNLEMTKSSTKFWKFHFATTHFLQKFAQQKGKPDKWPWRLKDTQYGDFERTYLDVCIAYNPLFRETLKSTPNFIVKFIDFQFQFGNILNGLDNIREIDLEFERFRAFNDPNKHLILAFMLGITNHWTSLIAHKFQGKTELIFFDSQNTEYLKWNDLQIDTYVDEENKIEKLSAFKTMIWKQTLKDIRDVLFLFSKCLTTEYELIDYHFKQRVNLLIREAEENVFKPFGIPICSDFNLLLKDKNQRKIVQEAVENLFFASISHFHTLLKISKFLKKLEAQTIDTLRWVIVFMKDFETPAISERKLLNELLIKVCYMGDIEEGEILNVVLRFK